MDTILPGLNAVPNIHPLLVHFPIALWPTALVVLGIAYLRDGDELFKVGSWLLYAGVLAGVAAATTGWLAADSLGHDQPGHELVHAHRNFMLFALAVAMVAGGSAHWTRLAERRAKRWLPVALLLVAFLLASLGADRGALLVYGHGVGVRKGPPTSAAREHHSH